MENFIFCEMLSLIIDTSATTVILPVRDGVKEQQSLYGSSTTRLQLET